MADPTAPIENRSALDIHPKVTLSIFAGAIASVLIGIAKAKGIDISGYESDITVLVMGTAAYFTPGA